MKKENTKNKMDAKQVDETCRILDGVASVLKAVSMMNNGRFAKITVETHDEVVVLPKALMADISDVLQRYVNTVRPMISALGKEL